MKEYVLFANMRDLTPEAPVDSIISRSLYKSAAVNVTLFAFAAGQELSDHTAPRPAVLHFLEGEARLTLGEDVHDVAAGAWVLMPANLTHAVAAKTEVTMLLYLYRD